MSRPKRHHYLPQCYLEGFLDPKQRVWVFDRKKNEYRNQAPIDTTVEYEFYTVVDDDGNKHVDIEMLFSEMEGIVKPMLTTLVGGGTLPRDDYEYFAHFLAGMFLRTPGYRKNYETTYAELLNAEAQFRIQTTDDAKRELERMWADGLDPNHRWTPDVVLAAVHTDASQFHFTFSNVYSIRSMLELAPKLTPLLFHMQWTVWHAPDNKSFITCDEPFVKSSPPGVDVAGLITPGSTHVFPLSRRACLVMVPGREPRVTPIRHRAASSDSVRQTNMMIALNCERFIVSSHEPLLRSIVRATAIDRTKPTPRFRVVSPFRSRLNSARRRGETGSTQAT